MCAASRCWHRFGSSHFLPFFWVRMCFRLGTRLSIWNAVIPLVCSRFLSPPRSPSWPVPPAQLCFFLPAPFLINSFKAWPPVLPVFTRPLGPCDSFLPLPVSPAVPFTWVFLLYPGPLPFCHPGASCSPCPTSGFGVLCAISGSSAAGPACRPPLFYLLCWFGIYSPFPLRHLPSISRCVPAWLSSLSGHGAIRSRCAPGFDFSPFILSLRCDRNSAPFRLCACYFIFSFSPCGLASLPWCFCPSSDPFSALSGQFPPFFPFAPISARYSPLIVPLMSSGPSWASLSLPVSDFPVLLVHPFSLVLIVLRHLAWWFAAFCASATGRAPRPVAPPLTLVCCSAPLFRALTALVVFLILSGFPCSPRVSGLVPTRTLPVLYLLGLQIRLSISLSPWPRLRCFFLDPSSPLFASLPFASPNVPASAARCPWTSVKFASGPAHLFDSLACMGLFRGFPLSLLAWPTGSPLHRLVPLSSSVTLCYLRPRPGNTSPLYHCALVSFPISAAFLSLLCWSPGHSLCLFLSIFLIPVSIFL